MVKSMTGPGKCYAISDGDRAGDPNIKRCLKPEAYCLSPLNGPKYKE